MLDLETSLAVVEFPPQYLYVYKILHQCIKYCIKLIYFIFTATKGLATKNLSNSQTSSGPKNSTSNQTCDGSIKPGSSRTTSGGFVSVAKSRIPEEVNLSEESSDDQEIGDDILAAIDIDEQISIAKKINKPSCQFNDEEKEASKTTNNAAVERNVKRNLDKRKQLKKFNKK